MKTFALSTALVRGIGLAVLLTGTSQVPALAGPIDGCTDFTNCSAGLSGSAAAIVQYTFSDLGGGYTPPAGLSPGLNDFRDIRDAATSQPLRVSVGDFCLLCVVGDFHSTASARTQSDFGINRASADTSFGAAGTDDRGNGRSASVRILTVAEARSSWRDAWIFTADGRFSAGLAIDGRADVATQNRLFPSTFVYGASGGFADWFYDFKVWDVDNISPDSDGFDGPTLVASVRERGDNEQRASFASLSALEFDFMAGVRYVVTSELGVTGRNGHSVDLFNTVRLADVRLSGGVGMSTLSGHNYLVDQAPAPVPEPQVWVSMAAGLALFALGLHRRRRH